jgi:hypothetical protein
LGTLLSVSENFVVDFPEHDVKLLGAFTSDPVAKNPNLHSAAVLVSKESVMLVPDGDRSKEMDSEITMEKGLDVSLLGAIKGDKKRWQPTPKEATAKMTIHRNISLKSFPHTKLRKLEQTMVQRRKTRVNILSNNYRLA